MKIAIGADHGAFTLKNILKEYLEAKNYEVVDFGCHSTDSVDYPPIAGNVAKSVTNGESKFGIVLCTTGIGVSISANKVKGIRAALCTNTHLAEMTRRHNNSNVLSMGAAIVSEEDAKKIADVFLTTEFEGDRHQRRIDLITAIENEN